MPLTTKSKWKIVGNWSAIIAGIALLFAIFSYVINIKFAEIKSDTETKVNGINFSQVAKLADERSQLNSLKFEQLKSEREAEDLKIRNDYQQAIIDMKSYVDQKTSNNRERFEQELKEAFKIHNEVDNQRFGLMIKNQDNQNAAIKETLENIQNQIKEIKINQEKSLKIQGYMPQKADNKSQFTETLK